MRPAPALVLAAALLAGCYELDPEPTAATVSLVDDRTIEFSAVVRSDAFDDAGMSHYHAVVWKGGRAHHRALFEAEVTDVQVLEALEALGAQPGNALTMETWESRGDDENPAPDQVLEGPPVELLVRLSDRDAPLRLEEILVDPGQQGFDLRFGGHQALIREWESGCIVCLYSCPGSKVGNAAYTVRDYVEGATRFEVRDGVLPADGTRVQLLLRLR